MLQGYRVQASVNALREGLQINTNNSRNKQIRVARDWRNENSKLLRLKSHLAREGNRKAGAGGKGAIARQTWRKGRLDVSKIHKAVIDLGNF